MGGPKVRQRFPPPTGRAETLSGRAALPIKALGDGLNERDKRSCSIYENLKEFQSPKPSHVGQVLLDSMAQLLEAIPARERGTGKTVNIELFANAEFAEYRVEDVFGRNITRYEAQRFCCKPDVQCNNLWRHLLPEALQCNLDGAHR